MDNEKLFLRPNVLVEPLVNRWNAYDQLVFPPSAAMVTKNSHLPILESYVADPEAHMEACREPSLIGGPWVNYESRRVEEVEALLTRTKTAAAALLELADAIEAMDRLLLSNARGAALSSLASRIPPPLRGYIEPVYDLNDHPSIHFIEGMLYRSRYFDRSLQSFSLSLIHHDKRPFQWSTPALEGPERLLVDVPFDSPAVNRLFEAANHGTTVGELAEVLGLPASKHALLRPFLMPERAPSRHSRVTEGVRVRALGHACVLIESREVSVLVDPFISYEYPSSVPRYTQLDLPERINYVLLTHAHNDHMELETLIRLRNRIDTVVVPRSSGGKMQDPSLRLMLQTIGFKDVREVHDLESIEVQGGRLVAVPFMGEHCDLDIQSRSGFLVQLENRSVMLMADSCNPEPSVYRRVHELFGDVDVLFLGMECDGAPMSWGYGKLMTRSIDRAIDQSRTFSGCDCDQALGLVDAMKVKQVFVYGMGEEPWVEHILVIPPDPESRRVTEPVRFFRECASRGVAAEKIFAKKELQL